MTYNSLLLTFLLLFQYYQNGSSLKWDVKIMLDTQDEMSRKAERMIDRYKVKVDLQDGETANNFRILKDVLRSYSDWPSTVLDEYYQLIRDDPEKFNYKAVSDFADGVKQEVLDEMEAILVSELRKLDGLPMPTDPLPEVEYLLSK